MTKNEMSILHRLSELSLKASKGKEEILLQYGEESEDYKVAEAYDAGIFTAYAIVKKIIDGEDFKWKKDLFQR